MYVLVSDAWFTFAIVDPPKRQNAPFNFIAFKKILCRSKYRIKLRQKATVRFIAFQNFSTGQNIISNTI